MLPDDRAPGRGRSGWRRRQGVLSAVVALGLLAGCSSGGRPDELAEDDDRRNPGPLPTMPGGVELAAVDPIVVLAGAELAFGTPLPSEEAAADGYTADPEVAAAFARRVFWAPDGRRLGDVLVLALDGSELFDDEALGAFQRAVVSGLGGGATTSAEVAGRRVLRAEGPDAAALAFREGDLLTVVRSRVTSDAELVVTRQLEAIARGEPGPPTPVTPLIAVPAGSVFIPMATVAFEPIPPPEEEPGPDAPGLPGVVGTEGRYGVVAGERRSVVWSLALDLATYPSAEALAPALPAFVAGRAEGRAPQAVEVIDRVVLASTNPDGVPSARVFRHKGLVLLVEGDRADQLDAVVSAWISELGPG